MRRMYVMLGPWSKTWSKTFVFQETDAEHWSHTLWALELLCYHGLGSDSELREHMHEKLTIKCCTWFCSFVGSDNNSSTAGQGVGKHFKVCINLRCALIQSGIFFITGWMLMALCIRAWTWYKIGTRLETSRHIYPQLAKSGTITWTVEYNHHFHCYNYFCKHCNSATQQTQHSLFSFVPPSPCCYQKLLVCYVLFQNISVFMWWIS